MNLYAGQSFLTDKEITRKRGQSCVIRRTEQRTEMQGINQRLHYQG